MNESQVVERAVADLKALLAPQLKLERGAALLYQLTLDNRLQIRPEHISPPRRGQSAFETDLCVFEEVQGVWLPRVVLEFKIGLSTHDILTYSAKAGRHKQIYPYLRYGLVVAAEATVPAKFFIHNQAVDFCFAAREHLAANTVGEALRQLVEAEIRASRLLEAAAFEKRQWHLFRSDVVVEPRPQGDDLP